MGLLKSVENIPNVDFYDYRDQTYYNKYKYRARLRINGIRFLYYVKTIDQWVSRITNTDNDWFVKKMSNHQKEEMLKNKDIINKIINYKNTLKKKETLIRQEGNTLSIFSNNIDILLVPKFWNSSIIFDITECKLGNYSGVKYFVKEPKNNYRVYLKSKKVSSEVIVQIKELLDRQPTLKPSKGLDKWLNFKYKSSWKYKYCSSSYSIDYNDESMISYLAICHGELLGKKYKLEKRNLTD